MKNDLILGDSLKTMLEMDDESVDVVLTDPPYPNGQGLFRNEIADGYAGLYLASKKAKRHVIFFWGMRTPPPMPPPGWFEISRSAWHKRDCKSIDHYELIIVWSRDFHRKPSRVYDVPILDYRTLNDWQPHPTQKPVKLIRYLLDAYTQEGDTVLDPFAGSGSTPIACAQMKRNCIAIEKSPEYAESATKRLQQQRQLRGQDQTLTEQLTPADAEPEPAEATVKRKNGRKP